MVNTISIALFCLLGLAIGYWLLLAFAAIFRRRLPTAPARPRHRFAIAIPAHDEAAVIAGTVQYLNELDYPPDLYRVHVVADHCTDGTAAAARAAGAIAHERNSGPRTGKGAALSWLFARILADTETDAEAEASVDAVVVFDADTQVDTAFLRQMGAYLAADFPVIQGRHVHP